MKREIVVQRCNFIAITVSIMIFAPAQAALKPQGATPDASRYVQTWQRDVARKVWQNPEADQKDLINDCNPFVVREKSWRQKLIELSPRFPKTENLSRKTQGAIYDFFLTIDKDLTEKKIFPILAIPSKIDPLKIIAELEYNGKTLGEDVLKKLYSIVEKEEPVQPVRPKLREVKTQEQIISEINLAIELYEQSRMGLPTAIYFTYKSILEMINQITNQATRDELKLRLDVANRTGEN